MLTYDQLTVRVEPAAEPGRYEVFVVGEAGEGHGGFEVPFDARDVENFVLRMSRGRRATRRIETSEALQAKDFGRRLFGALFHGEVRDVYRSCLADARRSDHGLRVTLALTKAPALMDLPWEYLYDEPDFLAASVWTPVVRYLDVAKPSVPLAVPPPLRILGMISRASDLPELDVETERRQLEGALRPLTRRGRIEVHWTQAATLESLLRKLRAGDFHVFHFIGHGTYNEARGDGLLLLQGKYGRSVEVTGERLARILNDHHPMRLAVLNACEGARASDNDPFAGVAASLVQRGLPAVVAMQFEITDTAAITFAEHFYSALALGYPVDAATAQARQGIYASGNDVEWGTPVLFLRPADGRIFDLNWEDARSEHAALSATLEAHPTEAAVGEPVTWSLYVQNTGMPSLFRATPEDAAGQPLCEPTDLVSGENAVFTWKSAATPHGNAVTVVASTRDGTDVRVKAEGRLQIRRLEPGPPPTSGPGLTGEPGPPPTSGPGLTGEPGPPPTSGPGLTGEPGPPPTSGPGLTGEPGPPPTSGPGLTGEPGPPPTSGPGVTGEPGPPPTSGPGLTGEPGPPPTSGPGLTDKPAPSPLPGPASSAHPVRRWLAAHRVALASSAIVGTLLAAAALLFSAGGGDGGQGGGGGRPEPIQLTGAPNGMSVVGELLWVSTRDGTVGVTPDGKLLRRAKAATRGGARISGLKPYLWVPIPDDSRVVRLDAETGKPLGAIDSEARPKAIALSSGSVYVSQSDGTGTWVQRYDARTMQADGSRITVPSGTVRLSVRDGSLWVLVQDPGEGRDRLVRYDINTAAEPESAAVGPGASAMAYSGGAFWVANYDSGTVTRVDVGSLQTSQYRLGGRPTNVRVGLGSLSGVWVTNPPGGVLQRLDPKSRKVTKYHVGQHPYSLAVTSDGVWVGDSRENNIRLVTP